MKQYPKIEEDFKGALPYWRDYFSKWVFVHNSRDGLGPMVFEKILSLETEYNHIVFETWGYEEIKKILFNLSATDIEQLLGPIPTKQLTVNLGNEVIKPIILNVARKVDMIDENPDLRPVPANKIDCNGLNSGNKMLLKIGICPS